MFSIPHLIIVFVVALVVFGPEKLPELARNLGKIMNEFKKATGDLRSTFEGHLRDLEREADQRRVDRESSVAASASSVLSASSELSIPPPAAGTIPTIPGHIAGDVTPHQEGLSTPSNLISGDPSKNGSDAVTVDPEPSKLEPEHHPETLTDGRNAST